MSRARYTHVWYVGGDVEPGVHALADRPVALALHRQGKVAADHVVGQLTMHEAQLFSCKSPLYFGL
jgi:hypothetical protein